MDKNSSSIVPSFFMLLACDTVQRVNHFEIVLKYWVRVLLFKRIAGAGRWSVQCNMRTAAPIEDNNRRVSVTHLLLRHSLVGHPKLYIERWMWCAYRLSIMNILGARARVQVKCAARERIHHRLRLVEFWVECADGFMVLWTMHLRRFEHCNRDRLVATIKINLLKAWSAHSHVRRCGPAERTARTER